MIENLATRIAIKIKEANPNETASIGVMRFALIMIIGTGSAFLFSMLISAMLGNFSETIIVLLSFSVLRLFTGGFHFKNAELCTTTSIIGAVLIPFISLSTSSVIVLTIVSLIVVLWLAPIGINQSRIFSQEHYPHLKGFGIAVVSINFYFLSDILSVTFLLQSLTMLVSRMKGGDRK